MKRHPLDITSLIFGLVFALFGLVFLVSTDPWDFVFDSADFGWVIPAIVFLGGASLLVSVFRPRDTGTAADGTSAFLPAVESHLGAGDQQENSEEATE